MQLVLLWLPGGFLLIMGLIGVQASVHRIRHARDGAAIGDILRLVGTVLMVVVGGAALIYGLVYILSGYNNSPPPYSPDVT